MVEIWFDCTFQIYFNLARSRWNICIFVPLFYFLLYYSVSRRDKTRIGIFCAQFCQQDIAKRATQQNVDCVGNVVSFEINYYGSSCKLFCDKMEKFMNDMVTRVHKVLQHQTMRETNEIRFKSLHMRYDAYEVNSSLVSSCFFFLFGNLLLSKS